MPCQGYRQRACWLQPMRNSTWCATCSLHSHTDILQGLCLRIKQREASADTVLYILADPKFLQSIAYSDTLDSILHSMYSSRQFVLLRNYLTYIRNTSVLQAILYLRIRSHRTTGMCAVYSWMIRNSIDVDMFPKSCLCCMTSALSYSHNYELMKLMRTLDSPIHSIHPLRRLLHTSEYSHIQRFMDAVLQYAPAFIDTVVGYSVHMYPGIAQSVILHPCILPRKLGMGTTPDDQKTLMYKHVARCIESFKDELMEVTWDPSRVVGWCFTIEEQSRH